MQDAGPRAALHRRVRCRQPAGKRRGGRLRKGFRADGLNIVRCRLCGAHGGVFEKKTAHLTNSPLALLENLNPAEPVPQRVPLEGVAPPTPRSPVLKTFGAYEPARFAATAEHCPPENPARFAQDFRNKGLKLAFHQLTGTLRILRRCAWLRCCRRVFLLRCRCAFLRIGGFRGPLF